MEALKIWETAPFNSKRSKLEDMDIHEEYTFADLMMTHSGIFNYEAAVVEDMSGNDTQVYRNEILNPNRPAKETYEDEPILIPYIVPGSDRCIICCPGGGYLDKSMENEGEDIAEFLNAAGISCFVLWYRSYPYTAPVPFRDCQRAIRYVRYHAAEYGIDPEKIGIMGFSAGGNLCAATVEIFRESAVEDPAYVPDKVDAVSARVKVLGLIYAAVDFTRSTAFLSAIEKRDALKDPAVLKERVEYYTVKNHIRPGDPATFLACAYDDLLVPITNSLEYAEALNANHVPFELHVFQEGGHGFGGCKPDPNGMALSDTERTAKWKELFATWALKELDREGQFDPTAIFEKYAGLIN